ncbi:MAG: hypothetical protein ABSA71_02660 [Desulfomonilia bacterium]
MSISLWREQLVSWVDEPKDGIRDAKAGEVTNKNIWKVTNAAKIRFLIMDIIDYLYILSSGIGYQLLLIGDERFSRD